MQRKLKEIRRARLNRNQWEIKGSLPAKVEKKRRDRVGKEERKERSKAKEEEGSVLEKKRRAKMEMRKRKKKK